MGCGLFVYECCAIAGMENLSHGLGKQGIGPQPDKLLLSTSNSSDLRRMRKLTIQYCRNRHAMRMVHAAPQPDPRPINA